MGVEIERKFLVDTEKWQPKVAGEVISQGYLNIEPGRTVRIRQKGEKGFITIKGKTIGMTQPEYEYEIPLKDAQELLQMCYQPVIEKTRYTEDHGGSCWEIDVFRGANTGLVIAEVELPSENAPYYRPEWAISEVTGDKRYKNSNLQSNPYCSWKKAANSYTQGK